MAFLWILLLGALTWGLIKTVALIAEQIRLRRLLTWLNMDLVSTAQRANAGDVDGLVRDMAVAFRERAYLFCYRVEREIDGLTDEEMHPHDRTVMRLYITNTREMLDQAGPFDICGLTVDFDDDIGPEARSVLEPLRDESIEFHARTATFYRWLAQHGTFVQRPKGTA